MYEIITFPWLTPVTKPLLSTVAIAVLDETQANDVVNGEPDPNNCEVDPIQVLNVPETEGNAFTVKFARFFVQLFESV